MASNEKELLEHDNLNVNLKRVPSVGAVPSANENLNWERCQSDVNLNQRKDKSNKNNTQVSDNSTVYWDLSNTDDKNKSGVSNHCVPGFQMALETIHQHDEFGDSFKSPLSEDSTDIENDYKSNDESYENCFKNENNSLDRITSNQRSKRMLAEVETRKSCSALPISRRRSGEPMHSPNMMDDLSENDLVKRSSSECLMKTQSTAIVNTNTKPHISCANYFCESDYDANKEVIPNYQVKLKTKQDKFSELLDKLELDCVTPFQWPSIDSIEQKIQALKECIELIEEAWSMPKVGRDIASALCDQIRQQGLLKSLLECISRIGDVMIVDSTENNKTENELRRQYGLRAAQLFSQILTSENIDSILGLASGSSTPKLERIQEFGEYETLNDSIKLFQSLIKQSWIVRNDKELNLGFICILEGLLKHHEKTNRLIVKSGGLKTLVYSCRSSCTNTLRHLAFSMVNLALFGDFDIHCTMAELKVADWLFPLAFNSDDVIKYYACLAIVILSSHKELAQVVYSSGTLELVLSFLQTHSPYEFAEIEPSHLQGRSKKWLENLLPILKSDSIEAVSLASFHFVMEARIKQKQGKTHIFYEIGAVQVLNKVARGIYREAAEFSRQVLQILQETLPYKLSHPVPLWTCEDTCNWLIEISFEQLREQFQALRIDGDILLSLDDDLIKNDLHLTNKIIRKVFIRELERLKCITVYQPCDPSGLYDWIRKHVGSEYTHYTYQFLKAGVDRKFLSRITEQMLIQDCQITNSIHRARFLRAIDNCKVKFAKDSSKYATMSTMHGGTGPGDQGDGSGPPQHMTAESHDSVGNHGQGGMLPTQMTIESHGDSPGLPHLSDGTSPHHHEPMGIDHCIVSNHADDTQYICDPQTLYKSIDVFISYRRNNGAQLASLLMVHLRLRGYRVFLDIERLPAGKFNENLLQSIQRARNFIIVLTPNSLDRCFNDTDKKDWIHREIACALQNGCNIIPVTDRFEFPSEDKLPKDISSILNYNAVNWVHDYQEACVEKIEQFMLHPPPETNFKSPFSPPQLRQTPIIPASSYSPAIIPLMNENDDEEEYNSIMPMFPSRSIVKRPTNLNSLSGGYYYNPLLTYL